MCDGQQMQHGIGRTTEGHHYRNGVLERLTAGAKAE
jgi:hypothetical protein